MTNKTSKQIRSILSLALLFSALITTTGCFGQKESAVVNKSGRTRHQMNKLPEAPSRPDNPNSNRPEQTQNSDWISIDLAHNGNNAPIKEVAEDFIDDNLSGNLQDIQIQFYNGTLAIVMWDDQAVINEYSPFHIYLEFDGSDDNGYSYSDYSGIVDFNVIEDLGSNQYKFQVSFENRDGSKGILGHVSLHLCEFEGTC